MSDDYLFDPEAEPDPEIVKLERELAQHRYVPEPFAADARTGRRWWILGASAAAAVVIAFFVVRAQKTIHGELAVPYTVEGIQGRTSMKTADELTTGIGENARLTIGTIGHVDVEPNSTLRVVTAFEGAHNLYLERGAVHATIFTAPRAFQIGTPAGKSIDLGCEYALDVDDAGVSHLSVLTGQVAFELDGREVYVPAHAACTSVPGRGPSAPVRDAATVLFRIALEAVEFAAAPTPAEINALLRAAERADTLTLWHLYDSERTAPKLREAAYLRLVDTFPLPASVTTEGLERNDRTMRRAWLETMKPDWRTNG
jgi:hypothetical protein